jgi:hypothetical protein
MKYFHVLNLWCALFLTGVVFLCGVSPDHFKYSFSLVSWFLAIAAANWTCVLYRAKGKP